MPAESVTPCVEAQGRAIDRQTLTPFFVYGGVDDPLRVVASGQAEGGHANCGRYGPGCAWADPGVVMLGERYDGRGTLCCELKRAWRRVVGEENNPLCAVCQHLLECQQLVALRRKDDRDVLGPPRNVPRGGRGRSPHESGVRVAQPIDGRLLPRLRRN